MAHSGDIDPLAKTLAELGLEPEALRTLVGAALSREVEERDPGETMVDPGIVEAKHAPKQVAQLLDRLQDLLDLPASALPPAPSLSPDATIDDLLGELYEKTVLDKRQFVLAHSNTELDLGGEDEDVKQRYLRLGVFDEGGAGQILVAKDQVLRRKVAVKQLKAGKQSPEEVERFKREAQITAQLDHPNIVPIYSFEGEAVARQGGASYAMKLIKGVTLRALIKVRRSEVEAGARGEEESLADRLEHFIKVCDAMSYAHSRGVIHRDLKPANIMIGSYGEVYVMDWGLARLVTPDQEGTAAGGTPFYMSPEQARAKPEALSVLSDVFTLGLILYELSTLHRAYHGTSVFEVISQAQRGKLLPFRHIGGHSLSPDLESIVAKATSIKPESRYPDTASMAEDVRRYLRGEEVSARPDNWVRKSTRALVRHRGLTLSMIAALVMALAVAVIWSLVRQQEMLESSRHREAQVMAWQSEVSWHATELERELRHIETLTQRLGRAATLLLAYPNEYGGRVYDHDRIEAQLEDAPPDFLDAPSHQMKASFLEPIIDLPPGVTREESARSIRQLYPLKRTLQEIFLDYRGRAPELLDERVLESMRDELVPLRWAYLALENGLYIGYPGTLGLPEDYDSRDRPWYATARNGGGAVVWGAPYYGVQAGMLGMPALMAIYDNMGRFQGVAAVEIQVERLVSQMLQQTKAGDVELSILDPQGRVITTSGSESARRQDKSRSDALTLEPYKHAEVIEAIKARRSGYLEVEHKGRWDLVSFHSLPTLGWFYVEEIPREVLLGED